MSFFSAAVAIVAIIAGCILSLAKSRIKYASLQQSDSSNELHNKITAMQERIEVLEKIVTDSNYDLKKQFRDLENDKVA